ncbi:MAG: cbb3-type cytochrome c oxidase subunit 3 [Dokdonella sp.]
MNAAWGQMAGVITVLLLVVFIGIWIWAWRPRNKKSFDEMAKIPMQDEDLPTHDEENKQ